MSASSSKNKPLITSRRGETVAAGEDTPEAQSRRLPLRGRHLSRREREALRTLERPAVGAPRAEVPSPQAEGSLQDKRRRPASARLRLFVPCPRGLEAALADELRELGAEAVEPAAGGVGCAGDLRLAWRINLWSRLAVRVLQQVDHGRYRNEDELYRAALALPWPEWFDVRRTLAVHTVAHASPLKSLNFASLRIKDAVCDRFRAECGARPSVDTRNPEVPLVLYLERDRYTLYLDLSGAPLNRRGFRVQAAAAPLNENLAAGILRLTGWRPDTPLLDPMMGGGTILIEAAMLALNRAPGLKRHFAFEHLRSFDRSAWSRLRKAAEAAARPPRELPIFGYDIDPAMVRAAQANLRAAGLLDCVHLAQADALELSPPTPTGILVSNPPYGVRLPQAEPAAFYRAWRDVLKQRFASWTAWLLSADPELPKRIGLRAAHRIPLYNGALACRLYEYRLVRGRPS